ncbi:uncharacterized protein [Cherax quadricarinatus]|uniref:uncharacterized protein n=1 Tax=Cherax quadricarinatus TaxID=27406 RepID=UPI00387EA1D6
MIPKRLWELCIDRIVKATLIFQELSPNAVMVWAEVKKVWDFLWKLSRPIPVRATQLLHTHLWHATYPPTRIDITRLVLTLLGSQTPWITLGDMETCVERNISPDVFKRSGVYSSQDHLLELDLSGVDLGPSGRILLSLLPWCRHLSTLKLGVNATFDILYAAQACPLVVLHVSERNNSNPQLTEDNLIEMILGIKNRTSVDILNDLRCKRDVNMKATWPKLKEFTPGRVRIHREFMIILMVSFNGFHCVPVQPQAQPQRGKPSFLHR